MFHGRGKKFKALNWLKLQRQHKEKWTGEEMQFLQQVVIDYKAAKTNEGLDWKVIRSKYEEIAEGIARPSI